MPKLKPTLVETSSMFGTTIHLATKDGAYNEMLVENFQGKPVESLASRVGDGYLFRAPNIKPEDWEPTFELTSRFGGKFSLSFEVDSETKQITGLMRIAEREDAAMLAWADINIWQKWSESQEKEAKAMAKAKPPKVKIGKDGKVTIKVKVSSLDDSKQG